MTRFPASGTVGRRRVLAGLSGLGVASIGRNASAAGAADDGSAGGSTALEPSGSVNVRGVGEAVVDDDGTTVYCSLRDGFGVFDVSDPAEPTLLYEERDLEHDGEGPMERIMDVKLSGDRLLVPGPTGYSTNIRGFFLYDVSDPASPERVAFQKSIVPPHNSFIAGDYVYLTGTGLTPEPVIVYDVTDDDPEEVARWSILDEDDAWSDVAPNYRGCHDIYVQGETMYVAQWDAGTWLVDVSDPTNPTATAQLGGVDPAYLSEIGETDPEFSELPGNSHYVQPNADGSRLFVGKEAWDRGGTETDGGPGGIECWDLSGAEPELATVLRPPVPENDDYGGWTSHNFGIREDRLYTSWYSGGVRVYDVADLGNPTLLGEWRDPGASAFWTAKPTESGFVGASHVDSGNSNEERRRGEGARLYAFPEPDAGDGRPAPTMDRRPFPDPEDAEWDGTTTPPSTTTASTTTDATEDVETTTVDEEASGPTPGFGVLAALAGSGLAARRLLARTREE